MDTFWGVMFIVAVVGVMFLAAWTRERQGIRPTGPSRFTRGWWGNDTSRSYKPLGVTARTPSGVTVAVRCPHRGGHSTVDHAVACGLNEKDRIEKKGR